MEQELAHDGWWVSVHGEPDDLRLASELLGNDRGLRHLARVDDDALVLPVLRCGLLFGHAASVRLVSDPLGACQFGYQIWVPTTDEGSAAPTTNAAQSQ